MNDLQTLLAKKAELDRAQRALEAQLNEFRQADRVAAIAKIKALMAEHGLTAHDLAGGAQAKRERSHPSAGTRIAPKYRDPLSGSTWTGRGQQPRWMRDAINNDGKTLESFKINEQGDAQ